MKPLISIIVPVYNVELYLDDCLNSLAAMEGCGNAEFILVDDGSTDRSGAMCDAFCAHDQRFRVIHTPNGGLSAARNVGLDEAGGEWVMFVDSDDAVHPRLASRLLAVACETGADMAICGYSSFCNDFPRDEATNSPATILSQTETLASMLYQNGIEPAAWARISRRNIFDCERFTEGILYEDIDISVRQLLRCKKVAVIADKLYYYRQRSNSILHHFSLKRLDVIRVTERNQTLVELRCPELSGAARERRLSANFNMFGLLCANSMSRSAEADDCWTTIRQLRRSVLLDPRIRRKSRAAILLSYCGRGITSLIMNHYYKSHESTDC